MRRVGNPKRGVACAGALVALLLAVPIAIADPETERAEYKAQVEPICKTNTLANKRIFKGLKGEIKRGELDKAAKRFKRAVVALDKAIKQIDAVPKPPTYTAKLTKWVSYLRTEEKLFREIGKALAAGKKGKAESLSVRLKRNSNLANNTVLVFEFNYCRIDPSRFS
jgi:hypothetical protein